MATIEFNDKDDVHSRDTVIPPPAAVTVPAPATQQPLTPERAFDLAFEAESEGLGLTAVDLEPISDASLLAAAKDARSSATTQVIAPITDADLLLGR